MSHTACPEVKQHLDAALQMTTTNAAHEAARSIINGAYALLTDAELIALCNAAEVELINRAAALAGYVNET